MTVLPSQIKNLLTERDFCCSAKPFKIVSPYLVAELEIYCLEKDQEKILSEIQRLIKQDGLFEASYLTPNYPRKEIKFLITWYCLKNSQKLCHFTIMDVKNVIGNSYFF